MDQVTPEIIMIALRDEKLSRAFKDFVSHFMSHQDNPLHFAGPLNHSREILQKISK